MTGLVLRDRTAHGRDILTGKVNGTGGQMVVTRNDNGISSINAVFVQNGVRQGATVRTVPAQFPTIQAAIDAAGINDLILVAPGTYTEMVIMWKPVQLQGWGEGTMIDAVKNPPESLQIWREAVQGLVEGNYPPANPPGYTVTLVPGQEAAFGGVEPAALWTEEGTGILVLARAGAFSQNQNKNARIDGFSISGADTGGGIIVNGFASDMRISNTRVINNSGQYGGGIRLGHPTLIAQGAAACGNGVDLCYPDAQNDNIVITNNYIGQNGGMNGAGGGVSLCTGSENYRLTDNYICGNFNMRAGRRRGPLRLLRQPHQRFECDRAQRDRLQRQLRPDPRVLALGRRPAHHRSTGPRRRTAEPRNGGCPRRQQPLHRQRGRGR